MSEQNEIVRELVNVLSSIVEERGYSLESSSDTDPEWLRKARDIIQRSKPSALNNSLIWPTDWKLWCRLQETGRYSLMRWGEEKRMRTLMQRWFERGSEVWLVAPDGTKHFPEGSVQE